ncbi:MAG: PD40 domain-containing protein [Gemmatimonadaceae bacterium]|nr:PD40 domain-containing protein [Gemmatimonadaceae bacterium]
MTTTRDRLRTCRHALVLAVAFAAATLAAPGLSLAQAAPAAPAAAAQAPARAALYAEPDPSPDGRELAFVSGGDIWVGPADGGEARLLVAHPANDFRPRWSPDGRKLAFVSTRTGNGDVYVLDLGTNVLRRLTFDEGSEQLDAWSPDGEWLYVSSNSQDIAGMQDVFRIRATGGTPVRVAGDRYASEYWAAPSPDGRTLAITARGVNAGQWWRRGSSHIDEAEIWTLTLTGAPRYTRVSTGDRPGKGRDVWPMWGPQGRTLYFVSDRDDAENLYAQPAAGGNARALTQFTDGRVLWPRISKDGGRIYFERDFRIWVYRMADSSATALGFTLRGAPTTPVAERMTLTSGVQDLALSPDGKKIAMVMRGDVFAADAKEGGDAARVTSTVAPEDSPAWAPDSRRLVYSSWRGGTARLYLYDFATRSERALTAGGDDVLPTWSPDGKLVAFVRGGRELRTVDAATGSERLVVSGAQLGRVPFLPSANFAFSPNGTHLAYLDIGERGFLHAYVVPVTGGVAQQVSFLANAFGGTIAWSPDAKSLYFDNAQRTEDGQIIRVDLVPRAPVFAESRFDALFPGDSSAPRGGSGSARASSSGSGSSSIEVRIDTVGLRRRASSLPLGVNAGSPVVSPDGKTLAFLGAAAGQTQVWTWPIEEGRAQAPQLRQVTSSSGGKGDLQWSADSKELWFVSGGRVQAIGAENRQQRSVAVTARVDSDFAEERPEVFRQVWSWTAENFYDAEMHGVDWDAVRSRYAPIVNAARTPDEMRRALALMIGELNASHSGVGGPSGSAPSGTGRLGVDFDRAEYERSSRLRIAAVLPFGPIALAGGASVGDYLVSVDGTAITAATNLDSLLQFTAGRRVTLGVSANADGRAPRELRVQPVSTGAEKRLRYEAWVAERREYVARVSRGRLGYVHMADMGAGSLEQLIIDLDAENHARDGVVIDIRNNNGGFVNAYALDIFNRRPYLTMERRGTGVEAPARLQLGQRAYEKPTVLVTNQHSLSDAEDFTEGYRALGLGQVVGEPTSGWIIYTSNVTLFDGTSLRVPFIRIRDAAGEDMELVPRPVDVRVDRPMGESYGERDTQLDRAVQVLLERLGRR